MRKNILILVFGMLLLTAPAHCQEIKDSTYKHVVKMNLAATAFKNLSLYYEHRLNEHWSLQLGAGYKFGGKIPKLLGLGDFVISSDTRGVKGFSITPEARCHFGNYAWGDLSGLYTGVYGRGTKLFGELDSQFASDIIPLIEEEINKRLEWLGMDPISVPDNASAQVDFRFNNFRYAIGVGYRF